MKLIDKLPKSYKELNYKTYIKIINSLPAEKPEDMDVEEWNVYFHLTVLSILLDVPVTELERLPAPEIIGLIQGIAYFEVPLKPTKTSLKLKSIDELTYENYINFQMLRKDMWNNMSDILTIIVKDKTKEEIDNLSVLEVAACFFILNKSIQRSMNSSLISLGWKIIKMKIQNLFKKQEKELI